MAPAAGGGMLASVEIFWTIVCFAVLIGIGAVATWAFAIAPFPVPPVPYKRRYF